MEDLSFGCDHAILMLSGLPLAVSPVGGYDEFRVLAGRIVPFKMRSKLPTVKLEAVGTTTAGVVALETEAVVCVAVVGFVTDPD